MVDVLVVDDDESYGQVMVRCLANDGISAILQTGPFGTINSIRRERPALVILDLNMPAISGEDVGKLIRSAEGLEGIKLMLLSSRDQVELDSARAQINADEAVSKSIERPELLRLVKRLLDKKRPSRRRPLT
jgi:DNA-binding response OmpR family regulator